MYAGTGKQDGMSWLLQQDGMRVQCQQRPAHSSTRKAGRAAAYGVGS